MPPTERLDYADPLLHRFRARVLAHGSWAGAPSILLDRSAFYPESGGQLADRGELAGLALRDVQIDDDGQVHHLLEGDLPLPAIGAEIEGRIDAARRRLHMALHTGQHLLSRALADVAHAGTVSSRLGETTCTIDVDRELLDEPLVAKAEDLVNAIIDDDVVVRAYFPSAEELATLPLRRAPKVTDNIRVVQIGDFDVTPCGGTHCTRSAQVGQVRVDGLERYKGKARITFSAGRRARADLRAEASVLRALGQTFTCGPRDVPAAVEKLRRELADARETLGRVRMRVAESLAVELRLALDQSPDARLVAVLDDASVELLRALAPRLTARPEATVFLAGRVEGGLAVIVSRGSASRFDCGAFLKKAAAAAGGRGGGRAEHAEGRLPPTADWPALVAAATA
jgi:alanyl-tRNA synthetase